MNIPSGKYRLISHGVYDAQGTFKASSEYLKGEINYGPESALSLLIVFSANPQTSKEVLSYVGTYKVISDNLVQHHISLSSAPALSGTVEERTYRINGSELKLGKVLPDDRRFEAVWQRI